MFRQINTNPYNITTYDCIIRALSLFLNQTYDEILDSLFQLYKQTGYHIGDPVCFMLYLKRYTNITTTLIPTNKNIILKEMIQDLENCNYENFPNINSNNCHKILVFCGNNHLTYVQDYVIMDTWNCELLKVSGYFVYEGNLT